MAIFDANWHVFCHELSNFVTPTEMSNIHIDNLDLYLYVLEK